MTKEYLEKEALNKIFDERCPNEVLRQQLKDVVDYLPTADVVEVVRCKDGILSRV